MKQDIEKQTTTAEGTPLYRHYIAIQEQHPNAIVFYRLGDFYQVFGDNAKIVAELLDLILTKRDCGMSDRIFTCGVPFSLIEESIAKLTENGKQSITVEPIT